MIGIIGQQLRALGHGAISDANHDAIYRRDQGINIVVEGFTAGSIEVVRRLHEQGARFLYLATEEPTDKGFNHGTQKEMVMRQQTFVEAAKYCEGIICLVPGEHVTRWYGQHAPAAYCELGYAPALVRRDDGREPDFDFGFFGSLSPRRLKLLKKLATRTGKRIKITADFPSQDARDADVRRCRVVLQIRKFEEMGLVSSSRCCTSLCLGRPILAEPHAMSKPWDEIVRFSASEKAFFDDALLAWATWRPLHAGQMTKFKEKLPPEACIGKALDEIGVLQKEAA